MSRASQVAPVVKNRPANAKDARDAGSNPGLGRSPGEGMATHPSILAWRIRWTVEPGRLQSMELQSWTQWKRLSMDGWIVWIFLCPYSFLAQDLVPASFPRLVQSRTDC